MNERSLAIGSALAAFVASLCCLGPLILGGMGLGAALVGTFAPLRPYFLTLSGVLLALAFYFVYRKPKPSEACEGEVCTPQSRTRRLAKPLLWLATLAVAALAFFPTYGGKLAGTRTGAAPAATVHLETVKLKVSGMFCEVCAGVVQQKLAEASGVVRANVDYAGGQATIQFDPAKTDLARLIAVVRATGYKASLVN